MLGSRNKLWKKIKKKKERNGEKIEALMHMIQTVGVVLATIWAVALFLSCSNTGLQCLGDRVWCRNLIGVALC